MRSISKTFTGTKALDRISFDLYGGEILAVVGQNGSGKSTLVKVLAGIHQADPGGQIEVSAADGRLARGARREHLHFIHQDLGLIEQLNTTENLDLTRPLGARDLLPGRRRGEHDRAAELVRRTGAAIDVRSPIARLSPAERTIVALARAMDGWPRPDGVLVLDEPTASFHSSESERLFEAIRRVARGGAGVLFISHRLDEIRAIADRVMVLRDGRSVLEVPVHDADDATLVRAIVGSELAGPRQRDASTLGDVRLKVADLAGWQLAGLSFSVRSGEILGVSGVLGSGREELGSLLFGAAQRRAGIVEVDGSLLRAGHVADAIEAGVGFVPANRARQGAMLTMNVRENLTSARLRSVQRRLGWIPRRAERAEAQRWARAVDLRPPDPERPLAQLSGGNQQKVVLAKWLRTSPRVLVLDEPTAGVDVGAKAAIYELVRRAARQGAAIVVSSSDSKELAELCDRVLALDRGRLLGELCGADLTEEAVLHASLATGAVGGLVSTGVQPERTEDLSTAAPEAPPEPTGGATGWGRFRRAASFRNVSALYLLAVMFVTFSLWEPHTFLTVLTWRLLLDNQAISAIVAVGVVVPLSAGVIDLALGTEVGIGAVLVARLISDNNLSVPSALILTLVAGAAIGVVIAGLIVKARIGSFIVTLAMSSVLVAVIDWISWSEPITVVATGFHTIATGELFGVVYPVYFAAGVSLLVWYVLEHTSFGRRVYATGANPEAARLAGVRTSRVILGATVTCGVVSAFAGVLAASQLSTGDPTTTANYLLPAFAAVFLGSTQFKGGRFNVAGTLLAVAVLAIGVEGLQLGGAPVWTPNLFNGAALLLAVGFAQLQRSPTKRGAAITRTIRSIGGSSRRDLA